jgi:hypothetical protein
MSTVAAVSAKPSAISGLLRDLDNMFVPPRPLASPADRARRLVDAIDWSQPVVVIWVPGSSGRGVPDHVRERLHEAGGPAAYAIDYQATWRLRDSVPDGEATLRELLRLVAARKRAGQRVVLLGESQGAWIISSVLRDPTFARLIDRAGLVAHPAMAPAHVHASTSTPTRLGARSREFNSSSDIVTKELGRSADAALDIVDSFARLDIGHALSRTFGLVVSNPGLLQALVASQLFRVQGAENPHENDDLMRDAVAWVLGS